MSLNGSISFLSCLMFAGSLALQAQDSPAPSAPPLATHDFGQTGDSLLAPAFKTTADLVNVYFSVRDKQGYITNIQKDGCAIDEDNVPQDIKSFSLEDNLMLTIGLLLDTSASQKRVLPFEESAATSLLKRLMRSRDQAFLISFDSNVDLLADLTNSPDAIEQEMVRATIHAEPNPETRSAYRNAAEPGTLLYDAVYLAAHDELRQAAGRKVLVVVTDGFDSGSQNGLKSAIAEAQRTNSVIYVLLTSNTSPNSRRQAYSEMVEMDRLARETGGRMIDVGTNQRKLEIAFTQIQQELRSQYLASYKSTNERKDIPVRQLHVQCVASKKVQVQKAYYAVADEMGDE
jgi:VWFA-related protein